MINTTDLVLLILALSFKSGICEKLSNEPHVRKGLGKYGKHYEDFSTCVTGKTDFVFYDIDLYPNEYINISCGSGKTLKPVSDGSFFRSSEYINPLMGPVQEINQENKGPIDYKFYGVNYYNSGDDHMIHYEKANGQRSPESLYFHCYDSLNKPSSTIQVNLIPDFETEDKDPINFEFDKFKYSRDGKNLTYIKSVRPGRLTRTTCKDSKPTVKYTGSTNFDEPRYSPVKKLFNTDIEYKDISREFIKEKEGAHIIDLRESDKILTDAERCKTVITCPGRPDRKLVYAHPMYHELKGLNSRTRETMTPLSHKDYKEKGFIVYTKYHDSIFINVPEQNILLPDTFPYKMDSISSGSQETIQNLKITKITSSMSLLDLSSVTNYKQDYLTFKASKTTDGKQSIMVLPVYPTCNLSERTGDQPENFCSVFSDLKDTVVVKASSTELRKLDFAPSFYTRKLKGVGDCADYEYIKLSGAKGPKIEKSGNKVFITFPADKIEFNPVYMVSPSADESTVTKPESVMEIFLTNSKTFIKNDTVDTLDKITDTSKFYQVNIDKESVNINCSKFFSDPPKLTKPVLYPKDDNKVFETVPNGTSDPSGLKEFAINDLFKVHGYKFLKTNGGNMKIDINNEFIYSNTPKPIYFICSYNVDSDDWRKNKKPYAVIAVDPNFRNMDDKLCGVNGSGKLGTDKEQKMCEYQIREERDFYPFYCPYDEVGTEPKDSKWVFNVGDNKTYISCRHGTGEKFLDKQVFHEHLFDERKNIGYSNVILFNKKTPLFTKGISNTITCLCKGPNFESIVKVTNGFVTKGLTAIFLSLALITMYNL